MNHAKRIFASAFAAALLLGLTACSAPGAPSSTPTPSTSALTKLTFVLDWTPNTNHTGLYAAIANGYFADAGLDVEVVQPPEDGAEVLVGSGKAQLGISFQDSMAPALLGDSALPITAVAAVIQHNTSGILSREGEGLDRPSGLMGKKYATWDLAVEKAILKDVVEADGGDFSKVQLVPSTVMDEVSALNSNSVDAIWVFYAWGGIATQVANLPTDYFAFADINPVFDYYTPVVIANNSFLSEHPDTAKTFLAALAKGYEYAAANPEDAANILMAAAPELHDSADLVLKSQQYLSDKYIADAAQWGVFDPARWNAFYNWLSENGLVASSIPENTGFTNDYLSAQ